MDYNEKTKELQKQVKEKADKAKKAAEDLVDDATKKAKEAVDKAKQALTPETIQKIKEIDKKIKEAVPNLIGDLPGPAQKVIEKLDKLIAELDPPEDDPEALDRHVAALRGIMEQHLKPFIDECAQLAKQEISLNTRRMELTYDLLLLLEAEAEELVEDAHAAEQPVLSTECGPKEVKATEKGDWNNNKAAARKSARDEARAAAKATCEGHCPSNQHCNYLEKRNSIVGPEERPNPTNPNETQYRYECTSEGTCQCE